MLEKTELFEADGETGDWPEAEMPGSESLKLLRDTEPEELEYFLGALNELLEERTNLAIEASVTNTGE